jgi:hypothetical protein
MQIDFTTDLHHKQIVILSQPMTLKFIWWRFDKSEQQPEMGIGKLPPLMPRLNVEPAGEWNSVCHHAQGY